MYDRRTLLGTLLAAFAIGAAPVAERPRTLVPGKLQIGTYFVNPPFEYFSNGAKVGFEVDLMGEIARRLGLEPQFVDTRWETILGELRRGRFDCIVGGITITPARERLLAWSVPTMITTLSLVIDSARTPAIQNIADLKNAVVGVQAATTDYAAALAMKKRGTIRRIAVYPFARIEEAMADLEAGRITAVMKVAPVAARLAAERPNLRILAQVPDDPQPIGIGFRKKDAELRAAVDGAIIAMQRDGTMARLQKQWNVP
jgi:ABC-type amino acid transport substrate-binding protein